MHSKIFFSNCNEILFANLPWSGESEGTFRFLSQAATCPPVRGGFTLSFLIAERQARKL